MARKPTFRKVVEEPSTEVISLEVQHQSIAETIKLCESFGRPGAVTFAKAGARPAQLSRSFSRFSDYPNSASPPRMAKSTNWHELYESRPCTLHSTPALATR